MSRLRRFFVPILELNTLPREILLPSEEARHVRVLRLQAGDALEVGDARGQRARGTILSVNEDGVTVRLVEALGNARESGLRLTVATAWPKGKRAAVLVEKCAELGASVIVPVRFHRGVVTKDDESEGLVRLRRIAAEASKQCRRADVLSIETEQTFADFLSSDRPIICAAILDPDAPLSLPDWAAQHMCDNMTDITLFIGPEGGLTAEEMDLADERGISRVRLATNVLRIETAALAACAVMASLSVGCPRLTEYGKEG
jgi:16S rRNA (uracil1498-N3)-methyltransferase